jgi:hypothetical protein
MRVWFHAKYVRRTMSATIQDVARNLGLSVRAVRLRIDALDGTLTPLLQRGENNQLIFPGEAVGMLRHLEEVRQRDAVSVKAAASIVRQAERERLEQNSVKPVTSNHVGQASNGGLARELIDELRARIADLEADRDHWRELALDYKRALPAPRSRHGFFRLFRRKQGTDE